MAYNFRERPFSIFSFAFSISRFRFWIYTAGTYVVGYALGMENWLAFFQPTYYLYLFYFFFPANIFIYGVNDLWDEETDRHNPKKSGMEHRLSPEERGVLIRLLAACGSFSLLLLMIQNNSQRIVFLAFLLLSYFYSARPLRFKEIPILDFASNMLYIMPGIFGYLIASGEFPPLAFILAGFLHIAAMHLFSAVPDIEYDREAGIRTSAVIFGRRPSLIICIVFWGCLSMLVLWLSGFHPLSVPVLVYPLFPALLLLRPSMSIEAFYWRLPYINTILGGLLFAAVTLTKLTPSPLACIPFLPP
ncbi:MAG: prenyltransferase [Methanomicrobiales archaeon]|nr:prenyltransferase [Methanomicrobiales archaeon]